MSDELLAVCRAAGYAHAGPELPRRGESPSRDRAQRDRRSQARPSPGQRRLRLPERRVRRSRRSTRRRRAASGSRRSCRWATRQTSPATTSSSTGSRTPTTSVLLLYLESFGNPRRFGRIARRITDDEADRGGQASGRPGARASACARTPTKSTRCSRTPACCGPRRWGRCSTSRQLLARQPLPARRPRGGADQRPRARRRSARTPARRRGCASQHGGHDRHGDRRTTTNGRCASLLERTGA